MAVEFSENFDPNNLSEAERTLVKAGFPLALRKRWRIPDALTGHNYVISAFSSTTDRETPLVIAETGSGVLALMSTGNGVNINGS